MKRNSPGKLNRVEQVEAPDGGGPHTQVRVTVDNRIKSGSAAGGCLKVIGFVVVVLFVITVIGAALGGGGSA